MPPLLCLPLTLFSDHIFLKWPGKRLNFNSPNSRENCIILFRHIFSLYLLSGILCTKNNLLVNFTQIPSKVQRARWKKKKYNGHSDKCGPLPPWCSSSGFARNQLHVVHNLLGLLVGLGQHICQFPKYIYGLDFKVVGWNIWQVVQRWVQHNIP